MIYFKEFLVILIKMCRISLSKGGEEQEILRGDEVDCMNWFFEILLVRLDIDYLVCVECIDMFIDGLQKKFDVVNWECNMYVVYFKEVQVIQLMVVEFK